MVFCTSMVFCAFCDGKHHELIILQRDGPVCEAVRRRPTASRRRRRPGPVVFRQRFNPSAIPSFAFHSVGRLMRSAECGILNANY